MSWLNGVIVVYALLNIGGGILGYTAKQSVGSLAGGVATGVLLFVAIGMAKGNPKSGYGLAAFLAAATLAFFLYRFIAKHSTFPAVPMMAISAVVLVCLFVGHFAGSK